MMNSVKTRSPRLGALRLAFTLAVLAVTGTAGNPLFPTALSHAQTATSIPATQPARLMIELDWPMRQDPLLDPPPVKNIFNPRLIQLWLAALDRPDLDTRRQAADAIAEATLKGMPNTKELAGPKLLQVLESTLSAPGEQLILQLSCIQALAAVDYLPAASTMLKLSETGPQEIALLVDPALIRWKYEPATASWLARLAQPQTKRQVLVSAIESLAAAGHAPAAEPIRKLVHQDQADLALRLAAARALAALTPTGNDADATELYQDTAPPASTPPTAERLLAVTLLSQAKSEAAQALLRKMLSDPESAIVTLALTRLVELEARQISPFNEQLLKNADANVRGTLVLALERQQSPEATPLLLRLLDDENLHVRVAARRALLNLDGQEPLRPSIRAGIAELMHANPQATSPRQIEQLAYLIASIDDKTSGGLLPAYLTHKNLNVRLAVVVALRHLAIPETMPALLKRTTNVAERFAVSKRDVANSNSQPEIDLERELAQELQALALNHQMGLVTLATRYIPKKTAGEELRFAAIWSLGKLYAGQPQANLITQFKARINDVSLMDGELESIRVAGILAIGHMKADSELSFVRGIYTGTGFSVNLKLAARWAIMNITAQPLPEWPIPEVPVSGWFLEPME